MFSRFLTITLFLLLAFFFAAPAHSHPHNWIELQTTFVVDDRNRLSEVRQKWKFDIYYSMITMADILSEYKDQQTGLDATAREIITNLASYNYYAVLQVKNANIQLSEPYKYELYKADDGRSGNLEMQLAFAIEPAISVDKAVIEWQTYDPTYYIAMMHLDSQSIEVERVEIKSTGEAGSQRSNCSVTLEDPDPSEEIINYALSLDQSQRQTQGLGKHFAEKIRINCH